MTNRTSGATALEHRIASSGAAALDLGTVFAPSRRIRPAATATATSDERFARRTVTAPSLGRTRQVLERVFAAVGDRLGMPGRDAMVLASVLLVVGAFFGTAMTITAEPTGSHERQLEVQHAEWLAQQVAAGPAATMAP